jgi:hypothetical protein
MSRTFEHAAEMGIDEAVIWHTVPVFSAQVDVANRLKSGR